MKLSVLSLLLGLAVMAPALWGLFQPQAFAAALRRFPRSLGWGTLLMGLATIWFLYNLSLESVSDFADYKKMMYFGFALLGLLSCLFLQDYLSVRGLAVLFLLLGKLLVDTARWEESSWRWIIVVLAYVLILTGMWWTVSPWRGRDWANWVVASETRARCINGFRIALGLLLIFLGLIVF